MGDPRTKGEEIVDVLLQNDVARMAYLELEEGAA